MPNFLLPLIAVVAWGAMFTIATTALDEMDAVHLTAIRYVVASLIFLAILRAVEGARALRFDGRFGHTLLIGTAGFAGFNLLSFAALEHTSPEHAALVVAMTPVITVLYRWVTAGERPTPLQLACVVAAFSGVALVITRGDPASVLDGGVGLGELMVLGAVVCWVRYIVGAGELPDWSPLRFTALTAVAGTGSILAITAVADAAGWLSPPSAAGIAAAIPALAYLVVAGAVIAVLAWNAGVRRIGAADAALFMNLVPVVAFAIEAARGTNPRAVELAGAAITLAALVVANRAALSAHRAPQERHDGLQEVVRSGGGGERVEMARARAAVDEGRG